MSVTPFNVVGTVHNAMNGVNVWPTVTLKKTRLGEGRPAVLQELPQVIADWSSHWQVKLIVQGPEPPTVQEDSGGFKFNELLIVFLMSVKHAALTVGEFTI